MKTVLLIGTFDTKGAEFALLKEQIERRGVQTIAMNIGVLGTTELFSVAIEADEAAAAGGESLDELRRKKDRGRAMQTMADGAAKLVEKLYEEGRFDGIIGMGGSGGTSVVAAAMRRLPYGVPKVCLTTVASGDTSSYVGVSDMILIPSIVDISGVNRISRMGIVRAAGAIVGMVESDWQASGRDGKTIAASMFGNTTQCIEACRDHFDAAGFEFLVFHATGTGGKTLESLVDGGLVDAVMDLTTTELADQLCGGVFSAGADRLSAAGRAGIPQLIAPGCIDMVNFGPIESVPEKYRQTNRLLHAWNPAVTLMRTNREENEQLGRTLASKANASSGPTAFILPLRGVSILDGDGQPFCDREADQACFDAIKANLRGDIPVVEVDANINDPEFSNQAIAMMETLIKNVKE